MYTKWHHKKIYHKKVPIKSLFSIHFVLKPLNNWMITVSLRLNQAFDCCWHNWKWVCWDYRMREERQTDRKRTNAWLVKPKSTRQPNRCHIPLRQVGKHDWQLSKGTEAKIFLESGQILHYLTHCSRGFSLSKLRHRSSFVYIDICQ